METILVMVIVAIAVIFSIRRFIKSLKGETGCSCEASGTCNLRPEECSGKNNNIRIINTSHLKKKIAPNDKA